jgi:hypothetical protein
LAASAASVWATFITLECRSKRGQVCRGDSDPPVGQGSWRSHGYQNSFETSPLRGSLESRHTACRRSYTISEWIGVAATTALGVAGLYLANTYRRRSKIELAQARRVSYAKQWVITALAAASRLKLSGAGTSTPRQREPMHDALSGWHYRDGNEMLPARNTGSIFMSAKPNLVYSNADLKPDGPKIDGPLPRSSHPPNSGTAAGRSVSSGCSASRWEPTWPCSVAQLLILGSIRTGVPH